MIRDARGLADLLSDEPAWPVVESWIANATNFVEMLPARAPEREVALCDLQVTTRSAMGAVVYETGGLLVDFGWLRVLGSGHPKLPRSVPSWNRTCLPDTPIGLPWLIVADDVLGGTFAVDSGQLSGRDGLVHYFAPDALDWECLNMSYADLLFWALQGDVSQFYEEQRWPGWEQDVQLLAGDQAMAFRPHLWMSGPPVALRSRRSVLMSEWFSFQLDQRRKLLSSS